MTRERRVLKKLEETDGQSVWGPYVKSLLDDIIVKWHVKMGVVGGTSLEVSPFSTHGADQETYQILYKAKAWLASKKIEDEIKF